MTKEHRDELLVGVTVFVALILLIGLILWGKGVLPHTDSRKVSILFDRVGGLTGGDPVTLSGVEVGRVSDMELRGDSVRVMVSLRSDVELREGLHARLVSAELMGGKRVELLNGKGPVIGKDQPAISGRYLPGLAEITTMFDLYRSDIANILKDVRETVQNLREVLGTTEQSGNLQYALQSMTDTARRLDSLIIYNMDKVNQTVDNMETTSSVLRNLLEGEEPRAREMLASTQKLIYRLHSLADTSSALISRISADSSSLGRILEDDSLYQEARRALNRFDSLIVDFQTHPERYFENVKVKISPF